MMERITDSDLFWGVLTLTVWLSLVAIWAGVIFVILHFVIKFW